MQMFLQEVGFNCLGLMLFMLFCNEVRCGGFSGLDVKIVIAVWKNLEVWISELKFE